MENSSAQALEDALRCIELDDLENLRTIVPEYVPVDVRLKE